MNTKQINKWCTATKEKGETLTFGLIVLGEFFLKDTIKHFSDAALAGVRRRSINQISVKSFSNFLLRSRRKGKSCTKSHQNKANP